MKQKTIYISDLDGTLLGTDSRISQRSASIIDELSVRGALVTVATARTPATVVPLLAGISTNAPAIVMTGCARWERADACFSHVHFVPSAEVIGALDICRCCGVHPFVYVMADDDATLDVYHGAPVLNKAEENFWSERCNLPLKRFHLGTPAPPRALHRSMLFYGMGPEEPVRRAAEAFRQHSECSVCCYPDIFNPHVYNLEIFPPGVSKATAVQSLKESCGADRLVVFGDSLNDLPMFEVADMAVAVGNALPEVKEAAHLVIEPNYTDAVARFIEKDFES